MHSVDMLIWLYAIGTIVLIVVPMIPVIQAVWDKEGYAPLPVNLKYTKDPRAIAKQFDRYFTDAYDIDVLEPGARIESDKLGTLEVLGPVFGKNVYREMVYLPHKSVVPPETKFEREVVARDEVAFGDHCYARVVKTGKKLILGEENCIVRWIDAEGAIYVGRNSHINIASTPSTMHLERGVTFHRLYAYPILTSHTFAFKKSLQHIRHEHLDEAMIDKNLLYISERIHTLSENSILFRSMVTQGDLKMERGAKVFGNIKVNGDVTLADDCFVDGNIIAEGSITVGENCFIAGDLFSRESIEIGSYSQVGTSEHTKSVVAKKRIRLAEHIAIFNYLLTDEVGEVG